MVFVWVLTLVTVRVIVGYRIDDVVVVKKVEGVDKDDTRVEVVVVSGTVEVKELVKKVLVAVVLLEPAKEVVLDTEVVELAKIVEIVEEEVLVVVAKVVVVVVVEIG